VNDTRQFLSAVFEPPDELPLRLSAGTVRKIKDYSIFWFNPMQHLLFLFLLPFLSVSLAVVSAEH
jgi:hypothetical protein